MIKKEGDDIWRYRGEKYSTGFCKKAYWQHLKGMPTKYLIPTKVIGDTAWKIGSRVLYPIWYANHPELRKNQEQ